MALADLATGHARSRVPMVRPRQVAPIAALADLRAEPRDESELVDQSSYGEWLTVLGERGDWLWVQGDDHYFGWIARTATSPLQIGSRQVVGVLRAEVRAEPDPSLPPVALLPAGTVLMPRRREGEWAEMALGWVRLADLMLPSDLPERAPTADDLIATARAFLGTPYLWGGTSGGGIDCSGLVQQVYRLNGVGLDRDADQQATLGRPVTTPVAGDLLFFGSPAVTHVALSLGADDFLHAPMRGGFVEERKIGPDRAPVAIRRYLVDPE